MAKPTMDAGDTLLQPATFNISDEAFGVDIFKVQEAVGTMGRAGASAPRNSWKG